MKAECDLKLGQLVLVRENIVDNWKLHNFSHKEDVHDYVMIGGTHWKQCIAYKGNENLHLTTGSGSACWKPKVGELCAFYIDSDIWVPGFFYEVFTTYTGFIFGFRSLSKPGCSGIRISSKCEPISWHFNFS